MQIVDLFPTPIYLQKLNRELTGEEKNFFENSLSNVQFSTGNNSTVDKNILDNKTCSDLKSWATFHVNDYVQKVFRPTEKIEIYITISWLNITKTGEFHHLHTHSNSFVSGVFFIDTTDEDKIYFHKNTYEPITFTPKEYNMYNSYSWWISAEKNTLCLFPSSLWHSVPPIQSKKRISLSFNTFIRGQIGDDANATKLILK